jgi:hypothetical protein
LLAIGLWFAGRATLADHVFIRASIRGDLAGLEIAGKIFPENKFLRAAAADALAAASNVPPSRRTLAVLEAELARDPYAFNLVYVAAAQHMILGDAEQAELMFQSYAIRAPRSTFARQVQWCVAHGGCGVEGAPEK